MPHQAEFSQGMIQVKPQYEYQDKIFDSTAKSSTAKSSTTPIISSRKKAIILKMPYLSVGQQRELEEVAAHRLQILRASNASDASGLKEARNFVLRVKERLREDRYQEFLVNFPKFGITMQKFAFYEAIRKILFASYAEHLWYELKDTYLPKHDAESMTGEAQGHLSAE
ncbi:MAG: hypothetical protein LQ350_003332 [Teloschistes chrysophthalmus]|nr:MAG: hypothetical protein LQ350_003332 [Niorma chrysophthalma]